MSSLGQLAIDFGGLDPFLGRLPSRPYCADDVRHGLRIRPSLVAAQRRHIQVNPPWARGFLVLDIDDPDGAARWYDRNLPPPWWNAVNPANGHSHTCYALNAPVLLGDHARPEPMRYLEAVENALTATIGGDPRYSGLVTKNPKHRAWRVLTGGQPMTLGELAEYLPDLGKHKRKPDAPLTGIGRNVDTFDWLRNYSYAEVRRWWDRGFVEYQAHLVDRANSFTADEHPDPINRRECYHLARSTARWTWARMTRESFKARQIVLGRLSGKARRKGSNEQLRPWEGDGVSRRTWYRRRAQQVALEPYQDVSTPEPRCGPT